MRTYPNKGHVPATLLEDFLEKVTQDALSLNLFPGQPEPTIRNEAEKWLDACLSKAKRNGGGFSQMCIELTQALLLHPNIPAPLRTHLESSAESSTEFEEVQARQFCANAE